jgi:hypothetical protein
VKLFDEVPLPVLEVGLKKPGAVLAEHCFDFGEQQMTATPSLGHDFLYPTFLGHEGHPTLETNREEPSPHAASKGSHNFG